MKQQRKIGFTIILCAIMLTCISCRNGGKSKENLNKEDNQPTAGINKENSIDKETADSKDNSAANKQDTAESGASSADDTENKMDSSVDWDKNLITVYKPKNGGVWYPRAYLLKNGTILCGFDTNEDGKKSVIKIVSSTDGGSTWSKKAVQATDEPDLDCANANFIELPNGDIWMAYRANVLKDEKNPNSYYSSIRVSVSKDGGRTWAPHSITAEEEGTGGVYEPQFGFIGDKIAIFFANDSLNAVKYSSQQNIEFKLWEGGKWSEKHIASDGTETMSRDGMPVWCQLQDGSYAMVIEATTFSPTYPFIIQLKKSPDGLDWSSKAADIYIPVKRTKKAGAPYIVRLKDGRVAVSFQTDEDATLTGDDKAKMKVMISTDATASEFTSCTVPFDTPDGYCSSWNSMLCCGDYLYAFTSTNYPDSRISICKGLVK